MDGTSPEVPLSPSPADVEGALEEEIGAARALLNAQQGVWDAMCRAEPGTSLAPLLETQDRALDQARRAAAARASHLSGPGSLSRWISVQPAPAAERLRRLQAEASRLREEIDSLATQCVWLSRRTAFWFESQRALIGELAARSSAGGTYTEPGRPTVHGSAGPSLLDRAA